MRLSVKIVVWFNIIVVLIAITQVYDLLTQLNDASLKDLLVTKSQISSISRDSVTSKYIVPPIIHQTYRNASIPERWVPIRDSVMELNSEFEYKFWTDESAREFLLRHYPWFVATFDNYKFPIMRSDALRYFILYHYGGFYIDLDIGVHQSLDPLRKMPTAFYKTSPLGVSNGFMASVPGHPFFLYIMKSLERYNRNWFSSYLTVMYTGPLFVSILLQKYNWLRDSGITGADDTTVYLLNTVKGSIYQPLNDFIFHTPGSSWHKNDAWLFLLINDHQKLAGLIIPIVVTILVVVFLWSEFKLVEAALHIAHHRGSSKYHRLATKSKC